MSSRAPISRRRGNCRDDVAVAPLTSTTMFVSSRSVGVERPVVLGPIAPTLSYTAPYRPYIVALWKYDFSRPLPAEGVTPLTVRQVLVVPSIAFQSPVTCTRAEST